MKVFHRTHHAELILRNGFRDGSGKYMLQIDEPLTGVFVSDRPLDFNEGAAGDTLLTLELPDEIFVEYELVQEGWPYREAIVPAVILNRHGPPRVADE